MPDLSGVRFVFFDLDGVLVDSRAPISRCMNAALAAEGLAPEPAPALARWIGPPLRSAFEALLLARGADPGRADACIETYRAHYRTAALEQTQSFPGVADMLGRLSGRFTLGVATSKPAAFAAPILERLGLAAAFAHLSAPPLRDSHLEDKAATLARALAALGVPAAERDRPAAVMVGDRDVDVRAGRRHGLATVGATWGIGGVDELRGAGADWLADAPAAVAALLADAGTA